MEWLRWYHGAVSDPKWPLIARKAGVSVGVVVSVWAALLEHASQDEARGSVYGFDGETFDVLYGYDDGTCEKVVSAMKERGVVTVCHEMSQPVTDTSGGVTDMIIASWGKRQVQDEGATERKRLQREREKLEKERASLESLANEITLKKQHLKNCATGCHEMSQPVTECHLEQNRTEKNIEDTKTPPSPSQGGGEACASLPTLRRGKQPAEYNADFEAFWREYPRKVGKDAAWKVYKRRKHEIPTGEGMAAILARHSQTEQWQREGGQFIPHPATWLNQGRWADDVETCGTSLQDPVGW